MPSYQSPGVYVEELPSAIKAIAGVSTSTAAFIGVVPAKLIQVAAAPKDTTPAKFVEFTVPAKVDEPVAITNWTQFTKTFGDLVGDPAATATTAATPIIDEGHRHLAQAVYGFFNNGGSRCFVARVADAEELTAVLGEFEKIPEIALVCVPGIVSDATRDAVVTHCKKLSDRFAIFDSPPEPVVLTDLTKTSAGGGTGVMPKTTDIAAWYYPWIEVFDPATKLKTGGTETSVAVPPSGHIAGVMARVDTERGVFKAPANEVVRGALDVARLLSKADQAALNVAGVNCIRVINNNIYVWGARTIGGEANADLKYINVRRTLLFLEKSIEAGTQWVVFEPNTPDLWAKITRNITAFLTAAWRGGALFGTTAQEAFFVKCDDETNQPQTREQGQVITEIGVAIVRPAEFVIFRVSQSAPTK